MSGPKLNKSFALTTAIVIAFIVYGSLFPFHFHHRAPGTGPLATLLATWKFKPEHFGNLIANILLYMPLGFFGVLTIQIRARRWIRFASILAIGVTLCVAIELTQFYDTGRVTTFADIYPNILGTAIGALAGLVVGVRLRWSLWRDIRANPVPCILLAAWLGYRLFPYAPTINLHKYWHALKPVLLPQSFSLYHFAGYCAMWLVVAALTEVLSGYSRSRQLLPLAMMFVLGAKTLIVNNVLSADEVAGAAVAIVAWLMMSGVSTKTRSAVVTGGLVIFVIAERLEPFHFLASGRHFGWIPFLSFMQGSMSINTQSFLEKLFLYGSLIWLLRAIGLRQSFSAAAVAAGLFVTSLAETHLPGRSAEITDAVMTLIIAAVFSLLTQAVASDDEGANPVPRHGARDKPGSVSIEVLDDKRADT